MGSKTQDSCDTSCFSKSLKNDCLSYSIRSGQKRSTNNKLSIHADQHCASQLLDQTSCMDQSWIEFTLWTGCQRPFNFPAIRRTSLHQLLTAKYCKGHRMLLLRQEVFSFAFTYEDTRLTDTYFRRCQGEEKANEKASRMIDIGDDKVVTEIHVTKHFLNIVIQILMASKTTYVSRHFFFSFFHYK